MAELEAAATAVTDELDAALGEVDKQLAQLQREQIDVNTRTAANWQAYLDGLTAAGVVAPPAAALRNPPAGLPEGMVPVAASGGGAQRGAAQLPRQPASLLVLPAETLGAVTAAMGAARAAVRARDRRAGVVGVRIAGAVGVRVRGDRAAGGPGRPLRRHHAGRPGRRAPRRPGLPRARASRASGTSASRWTRRRCWPPTRGPGRSSSAPCPPTRCWASGAPAWASGRRCRRPGPTGGALRVECGNPVYPPSFDGARAWGGYPNGLIPPSAMCPLGAAGHSLRCDAAAAYRAMSAAFASAFGTPICITDSYRTYASQVKLYGEKPALAAVPGTSNHGWGLAVDLCGGIETFGTAAVLLDDRQRRPVRLPAPHVGRPGQGPRGALALGVRGHLIRAPQRPISAPRGIVGGRSYRAEDSRRRTDMLIDCDTCTARGTGCADCVVTVLLGAPPGWQGVDPVVVPMPARTRSPHDAWLSAPADLDVEDGAATAEDVGRASAGGRRRVRRRRAAGRARPRGCGPGAPAAAPGRLRRRPGQRPPDRVTGPTRTRGSIPRSASRAYTRGTRGSREARRANSRSLVTSGAPRPGLSRQHHGRRVVAVRPGGRRPHKGDLG